MQNIHPMFVHFPVALLTVALAFELAWLIWRREALRQMGTGALTLAAASALVALATGLVAGSTVAHVDAAHELMETHEKLGIATLCLAVVLAVVRLAGWGQRKGVCVVFFVLLLAATGLVNYGAHLGGRLVYEFGVGTALTRGESGHAHEHGEAGHVAPPGPPEPAVPAATGAESGGRAPQAKPKAEATQPGGGEHEHEGHEH